MVAMATGVDKG